MTHESLCFLTGWLIVKLIAELKKTVLAERHLVYLLIYLSYALEYNLMPFN